MRSSIPSAGRQVSPQVVSFMLERSEDCGGGHGYVSQDVVFPVAHGAL
jgi:hypothetical protein